MNDWTDYLAPLEPSEPATPIDFNAVGFEQVRVAGLDLTGFSKVSSDLLVRHSEQDLWRISEDEDGEVVISRLFDDDGEPLKNLNAEGKA